MAALSRASRNRSPRAATARCPRTASFSARPRCTCSRPTFTACHKKTDGCAATGKNPARISGNLGPLALFHYRDCRLRDFFLGGGTRRFEQLRDSLGISRNILTARLNTLTEACVIERVPVAEGGKRCAYQLTDKGRDLLHILTALREWGDAHVNSPDQPAFELVDKQTGECVRLGLLRESDDAVVEPHSIRLRPGPGIEWRRKTSAGG